MKLLWSIIFPVVSFILVLIFTIAAAYYQRGYFAVGIEYLVPILLLVALLKTENEKRSK